jgi:hypothetical protein
MHFLKEYLTIGPLSKLNINILFEHPQTGFQSLVSVPSPVLCCVNLEGLYIRTNCHRKQVLLHKGRDPSLDDDLEHRRRKKPPTGSDDGECPSDKRVEPIVANVQMDVWNNAHSAQQSRQTECLDIPRKTMCRRLEIIGVFNMQIV